MSVANMACIILASGLSQRFGEVDKLQAEIGGKSVLSHVLQTAASLDFGRIFCVSRVMGREDVTWVENENPEFGQGHALRLGLKSARDAGWTSCILLLGDMPLVSSRHLENMVKKSNKKQSIISVCESIKMPPALFNSDAMDMILEENLNGGARVIFDRIDPVRVKINPQNALDVDTPADLARVARIMKSWKNDSA